MEVVEETMGATDHFLVTKGRRTKRPRPSSPVSIASTSSVAGEDSHGNNGSSSSAAMSVIGFKNTEEEEDMANCLILLAQGHNKQNEQRRKGMEPREGVDGVYECKTCNRSFPTFQALGGHRASHKKPKAVIDEDKKGVGLEFNINDTSSDLPLVLATPHHHTAGNSNNNNKPKVHECSICGSEFSSGQALGGHMRRHRNMIASMSVNKENEKDQNPRTVFALDLNLPAPEEDVAFSPNQQPLNFSAPTLVGCHY